jgi:hypothetical protein
MKSTAVELSELQQRVDTILVLLKRAEELIAEIDTCQNSAPILLKLKLHVETARSLASSSIS